MKALSNVEVTSKAKYPGRDMDWTERCTGTETTTEEKVFFHSSDTKIKAFYPKETCTFDGLYVDGHVYAIHVPAGTKIKRYDREVRFGLTEEMKVVYLGREQDYYSENMQGWKRVNLPKKSLREYKKWMHELY